MNQVGKPVYGNNLIGRDKEIRLIKELILAGQSIVIIAPRRMGILTRDRILYLVDSIFCA